MPNHCRISYSSWRAAGTTTPCGSPLSLPPLEPGLQAHHRHAVHPEHYRGDPADCHKFLLPCELYFVAYPEMTSMQKVSFVIQSLTAQAYDRAVAICNRERQLIANYEEFLHQFQAVFDHPDQGLSFSQKTLDCTPRHFIGRRLLREVLYPCCKVAGTSQPS